jgi:GAF domain-containing protein
VVAELAFPQVARLELDELLEQLVAQARHVQDTQGRLRGLLRANLEVARGGDVGEVLRDIVDAARELVHARFAAMGEVQDGHLVRFVHAGMDDETVARIGRLPEGKGLLGLLVEQPQRLRLRDIGENPCSVGFPEHHPQMRSFLGIPVRAGDRVFGNLYLADKQGAEEFTAEDEDLVAALAAAAGVAIENANMYVETRRRQQWQAGMVEISTQLLTGSDVGQILRQMVRHALRVSGADGASVTVPTDDPGFLRVAAAEGSFRRWQGEVFPVEGSASAIAMSERRAVLVANLSSDPRIRIAGHCLDEVGAAVIAPIASGRRAAAALIVSKFREKGSFDTADVDMIGGFAAQAALALELAESRRDNERLRLLEDRERIGEDLQHSVIQRLFALGLSIQAIAARVGDAEVKRLITDRVEEMDDIIRDIRAAVFALHTSGRCA